MLDITVLQLQRVAKYFFIKICQSATLLLSLQKIHHKSHPGNSSVAVNTENPLVPVLHVLRATAVTKLIFVRS